MRCWLFSLGIFLVSCMGSGQPSTHSPKGTGITASEVKVDEKANAAAAPLSLDVFSELPSGTKGCHAAYALDMEALQKGQYLIVTNQKGKAYIKVADRTITLKLEDKMDEGSIIKEIYKGSDYILHVITHKVKQSGKDTWIYTGQILLFKNSNQETVPIIGQVGC